VTPQRLVLWSRLGPFDVGELDRLLWEERKLFEWAAFIWPMEDLPFVRARMARPRGKYSWERRGSTRVTQPTLADVARPSPLLPQATPERGFVSQKSRKATHRCVFASMPRPAGAMLKRWEEGRVRRNDGATSASGRRKNETNAGLPP